ncbi:hypothetical protein O1W68_19915 [Rhodococcus sp. H36-A4]|uniref:hypothetical protein n=1 Tax=Rhodococcus sp. H36-A4 TaxID=3004353 RepID=UPI0022B0099E|nr:hypothetical protein [Rhodococcus sp. H36-A4]MCZ4080217.1 hypothetical protein [Rhodococcus sp. H36-A4]
MTLADSRTSDTALISTSGLPTLSSNQLAMMRAFFCYEFEIDELERTALPDATVEVVSEWVGALEMSGLFAPAELRTMSEAWLSEPDQLVSLLVGDVDEITARREVVSTAEATVSGAAVADLLRAS